MNRHLFPTLVPSDISETRDALHAYAGILGNWASTCRERRKHWWHASLRPSLSGLTTGVIHTESLSFEIELDINQCLLLVRTVTGELLSVALQGQAVSDPARQVQDFLQTEGVSGELAEAASSKSLSNKTGFTNYSSEQAKRLAAALSVISSTMVSFRAGIREETSPIQLWPHHFDLAMLWLPGNKVPDQDPENEEYADKQMNFGFTFGDDGIPEPYFYVTAYPSPEGFSKIELPHGTDWKSEGFSGAVLTYQRLLEEVEPTEYLLSLWNTLLAGGNKYLLNQSS
jgi:hypothetical protein